jgi:hypothetical protein
MCEKKSFFSGGKDREKLVKNSTFIELIPVKDTAYTKINWFTGKLPVFYLRLTHAKTLKIV